MINLELIVAVNKLDMVDWSEERFNEIQATLSAFLKEVHFKPELVSYVPISGITGENLKQSTDKMPWYKGPTLLQVRSLLRLGH